MRINLISFVYFIHCPLAGVVKIGFSQTNPELRFRSCETYSPLPLVRLGVIRTTDVSESATHRKFDHLRSRNEWFLAAADLMGFIADNAEPWPRLAKPEAVTTSVVSVPERNPNLPGRRPLGSTQEDRSLHIRVAEACLLHKQTQRMVASRYGVSLRTVQLWIKAALEYPEGRHLIPFARTRRDAD
jgi:hypothetical protein